jgi:hypothetical protein
MRCGTIPTLDFTHRFLDTRICVSKMSKASAYLLTCEHGRKVDKDSKEILPAIVWVYMRTYGGD